MFSLKILENTKIHCRDDGVGVENCGDLEPGLNREISEGIVAGLQSHLLGKFVLHASSIAIDDAVIALMGNQGAGKSSLSVTCSSEPFRMIADGMTVIDPSNRRVELGLPRWKLSDASIEKFGLNPNDYEFVNGERRKRYVPFSRTDAINSCVLKVVLWVTEGDGEYVESMTPTQQLLALVTNAYLIKGYPVSEQEKLLSRAGEILASGVVVKRLVRRKRWDTLPETVRLVRDLAKFA